MTDWAWVPSSPTPDRDEWLAAVEKVLRGRSFEKVLVGSTRDGLDIQPLYTATAARRCAAGRLPIRSASPRGWDVRQVHDGTDPAACAAAVLAELERGVTSIELTPPDRWLDAR